MNHSKHCLVFAHRGASADTTENTQSAFDSALQYGADGIETDVQLTKDEITVLWHDRFLDKVGLPKKHIDDFKYAQLMSMNFASGSAPENKNSGIMRLQAFVDTYRDHCQLLLEIKNRDWESTLRHEIKVQQTLNIVGQVNNNAIIVSSFNLDSLKYAHHFQPKFPLIYNLEDDQTMADIKDTLITCPFLHGLCLPIDILDNAIVDLLRDHEKRIAVYTCNSDEEISKALDLSVDILISDLPQKALMMRNA